MDRVWALGEGSEWWGYGVLGGLGEEGCRGGVLGRVRGSEGQVDSGGRGITSPSSQASDI